MSEGEIRELVGRIGELDRAAMTAARVRQDELTKPRGSLGRLEDLAVHVAGITGDVVPRIGAPVVIVMAADHGVAAQGVSAYPQAVTAQMVRSYLSGRAAVNAIAATAGARVVVVNMGVAADLGATDGLRERSLGRGTADLSTGHAMTRERACAAVLAGADVLELEAVNGAGLVAVGEMGIGNTTAASAITAVLCEADPAITTGRGTGVGDEALARKIAVVRDAIALHRPSPDDALDVLAKVGGFEIGAIAGAILAAAARRMPVVLDGFICGAAALIAVGIAPRACDFLIAAHRSAEPGHRLALDALGLDPLLDLGLRLGEGSGAALALPLITAALAAHRDMATFAEAGISGRA